MAIEIVDFPIKNGDFPLLFLVHQRVSTIYQPVFHEMGLLDRAMFFYGSNVMG